MSEGSTSLRGSSVVSSSLSCGLEALGLSMDLSPLKNYELWKIQIPQKLLS